MAEKNSDEIVIPEHSRSVAGKELPPVSASTGGGAILLMYQYKEPCWTPSQHKQALKQIIHLCTQYQIKGRGRVAPEGVNMTLSSIQPSNVREFCQALRRWDPALFNDTDFKITDQIPHNQLFSKLSIRKTNELVAYGLDGDPKAPSLSQFAGTHLEAIDAHQAMQQKDTVVIDVRNAYESSIGHFQPPPGGATLIDPKMRHSVDFPKWLHDPQTQQKLHNKNVLMYCTGGIRCERATALLNQISTVVNGTTDQESSSFKPKGVFHIRGGIERYMKSFPQGGYWRGKNYLFDKRREQVPSMKPLSQVEEETQSRCCLCRTKWTVYRGKFKCFHCGVPVILCPSCDTHSSNNHAPQELNLAKLMCELCQEGHQAPAQTPAFVCLKRKAETLLNVSSEKNEKQSKSTHMDPSRLFLSKVPLTITKAKLDEALGGKVLKHVYWLADRQSGAFYGSCMVEMLSEKIAQDILRGIQKSPIKMGNKKVKVSPVRTRDEEVWPPNDANLDREFPPLGF